MATAKKPTAKKPAAKPSAKSAPAPAKKPVVKPTKEKQPQLRAKSGSEEDAPKFKLPKTLAECADLLYETREKRLKVQKNADELEELEKALKAHIIDNLPKSQASGIQGKVASVTLRKKIVASLKDDKKFFAYIKKTGDFDLLQRRLNDAAVQARWEQKKNVPGVEPFTTVTISCTKRS
jgi:hypothetical protein